MKNISKKGSIYADIQFQLNQLVLYHLYNIIMQQYEMKWWFYIININYKKMDIKYIIAVYAHLLKFK